MIKNKEIQRQSMPKTLKYKGISYIKNKVLKGFSIVTTDQAKDPMTIPDAKITKEYLDMRHAANLAIAEARMDDTEILPLDRESFKALLKRIPKEKAQDSKGIYYNGAKFYK